MENIASGVLVVFAGAGLYVILGFIGVLLSVIGEGICKKFGLPESNKPFSLRDISVAILAITIVGLILWCIGFVANLVVNLF